MKQYGNKGFSLVELIIVIAIMAILVAVMVPTLIRWIEKSNVSSDTQLADTVRGAFLCAVTDAKVLSDPDSIPYLNALESTSGLDCDDASFNSGGTSCVLYESVKEILGIAPNQITNELKSAHSANPIINVKVEGGNVIVEIKDTDSTGRKNYSTNPNIVVD